MHGPSDFAALLALLEQVRTSSLTDAEKADVIAVAREFFLSQAYDERLMVIVERITAPTPVVVVAPAVIDAHSLPNEGEGDTETVPARDDK